MSPNVLRLSELHPGMEHLEFRVKVTNGCDVNSWKVACGVGETFVFCHHDEWSYGLFHFSASVFAFACADATAFTDSMDVGQDA